MKSRTIHRYGRLLPHIMPILIWLVAAACVVALFHRRAQRFEVLGVAQGQVRQIAANCRGRLVSVPVLLFQKVKKGDTVAVINTVLDNEHLEDELTTISAQREHLEAQLTELRTNYVASIDNRKSEWVAEMRAFESDVIAARLRVLEIEATIESDRVVLEELELNIKSFMNKVRLQVDDKAIYDLQKLKVRKSALSKKIEGNKRLLAQSSQELQQALDRQNEYAQNYPRLGTSNDVAVNVINKAVDVLEHRMNELKARHQLLILTAPFDAVVSQIQGRQGEAVMAGGAILTITEEEPFQVVAYASENQVNQIQEGTTVELIKESIPPQIIREAQVSYIGPAVEQMPARLWRNPAIPQWGRPVSIEIPEGMQLIPGEVVAIRGL